MASQKHLHIPGADSTNSSLSQSQVYGTFLQRLCSGTQDCFAQAETLRSRFLFSCFICTCSIFGDLKWEIKNYFLACPQWNFLILGSETSSYVEMDSFLARIPKQMSEDSRHQLEIWKFKNLVKHVETSNPYLDSGMRIRVPWTTSNCPECSRIGQSIEAQLKKPEVYLQDKYPITHNQPLQKKGFWYFFNKSIFMVLSSFLKCSGIHKCLGRSVKI